MEVIALNDTDRADLYRTNPERYATTGLSWAEPAHHVTMANGLFQVLMMVMAEQQGVRDDGLRRALRKQQARVEQRLSVVERAAWRESIMLARRADDEVVVYSLEKMADAFEEGAGAWTRRDERFGFNTLAGTMLGAAVGFAASTQNHRAGERFSVGPFGGLSKIAQLVTRGDVLVEVEDLPALDALVQQARAIPAGHAVSHENETCFAFYEAVDGLQAKLQKRDREHGWTC
jgi:hypothetical protein